MGSIALERAANRTAEHSVRCGKALLAAKEKLRHGEWLHWLSANWMYSQQTASRYMCDASCVTDQESLSHHPLEKLAAIANESAALVGGRSRPVRSSRNHELVYVVYWIVDKCNQSTPLYVGVTKDLNSRWRSHCTRSRQLADIRDNQAITIRVVDTVVGTLAEAEKVELKHIECASVLNPALLNRRGN